MTVLDIISSALRLIGVSSKSEMPDASDGQQALDAFNMLLDEWNLEHMMLYHFTNDIFPVTANKNVYSIGPGAELDTPTRPVQITSAFLRDTNSGYNIDRQLEIIPQDKYNAIPMKALTSTYPQWLNYNNEFPTATITLWPVFTKSGLSLGITQWTQLAQICDINQKLNMPPGYLSAFRYNLAIELAAEFGATLHPIIAQRAAQSKASIKRINQQEVLASVDSSLLAKGGAYNVFIDR